MCTSLDRSSFFLAALVMLAPSGVVSQSPRWDPVTVGQRPAAIRLQALAVDPVRQELIQFGGRDLNIFSGPIFDETWAWSHGAWRQLQPAHHPSARFLSAMTHLPGSGLLLFGGVVDQFGGGVLDDTWLWDGADWQAVATATRPDGVSRPVLVTDEVRGDVFLFDAQSDGSRMWRWSAQDWTPFLDNPRPADVSAALWNSFDGEIVVRSLARGGFETMWSWDGNQWVTRWVGQISFLIGVAFGADADVGGIVGTYAESGSSGLTNRTRLWRAGRWTSLTPAPDLPPGSYFVSMSQDPDTGRVLAFSGDATGPYWTLDLDAESSPASFGFHGAGCTGSAGTAGLAAVGDSLPRFGETFVCEIAPLPTHRLAITWGLIGLSDASSPGGVPLPIDLTRIGMPGCLQRTSAEWDVRLQNEQGRAVWSIPVPSDGALEGVELFLQAVVLDPAANPRGIVLSESARMRIGS